MSENECSRGEVFDKATILPYLWKSYTDGKYPQLWSDKLFF